MLCNVRPFLAPRKYAIKSMRSRARTTLLGLRPALFILLDKPPNVFRLAYLLHPERVTAIPLGVRQVHRAPFRHVVYRAGRTTSTCSLTPTLFVIHRLIIQHFTIKVKQWVLYALFLGCETCVTPPPRHTHRPTDPPLDADREPPYRTRYVCSLHRVKGTLTALAATRP